MSQKSSADSIQRLKLETSPGLSEYARRWQADEPIPGLARKALFQEELSVRSGSAFRDEEFSRELLRRHQSLRASRASLANLEALAEGAPCVITGQQPGLLGGPLYCAWKIAGAVGIANSLTRKLGRKVVPLYWCGADDSDFEEARAAWLWKADSGAVRAELSKDLARPGSMVGSLPGTAVAAVERNALSAMGAKSGGDLTRWMESADEAWDLGERTQALYLRLFGQDGLVTIDARSNRLRELGRELMLRYAHRSVEVAERAEERGRALQAAGFSVPLHSAATNSGLFRLREGLREKLEPEELVPACEAGDDLSPAVLLRPLLQDELLAPLAAVLGPSELHYHAQLAPAYELLGVEGAAPALRPQLTFFPESLPWPEDEKRQRALLEGGDGAREALGTLTVPPQWEEARSALNDSLAAALHAFEENLGDAARESKLARALRKLRETAERIEDSLAAQSLQRAGEEHPFVLLTPDLLGLRGTPQERAYATVVAWEWFGQDFSRYLQELGRRYVEDLEEGVAPFYLGRIRLETT